MAEHFPITAAAALMTAIDVLPTTAATTALFDSPAIAEKVGTPKQRRDTW